MRKSTLLDLIEGIGILGGRYKCEEVLIQACLINALATLVELIKRLLRLRPTQADESRNASLRVVEA